MSYYSKSEYKKIKKKFDEEWLPCIPCRIEYLKEFVGFEVATKLDFSKESLMIVSQLLLDNFKDPYNYGLSDDKQLLDAITTYIGEVYIKFGNGLISWKAFNIKPRENEYYFEGVLIFANGNGNYPPSNYPYIIHHKAINEISKIFNAFIHFDVENYKPIIPIPGRGGYAYQYFILLKDESFTLQIVEDTIQNYNLKFSKGFELSYYNDKHLLVKMSDDYYFHFSFDDSAGLDEESQSIASKYQGEKDKSAIASCKTRIEFWGDEDPNGDYINAHMSLLDLFISNEDIFIYDFRNGMFYDEF
ncbi:MAG: hypothetical protein RLZZ175_2996 [Bacteroidota bacterium]|jgi:hypothetical protein